MRTVGERIRYLREARKWTVRELSEISGVSYGMIGHIERGDRDGKMDVLQKLADALSISIGVLIDPRFDLERAAELSLIADGVKHLNDQQMAAILDMIAALQPPS